MINGLDESFLEQWIVNSLQDNTHILAAGYQGTTLIYQDDVQNLVIKVPHGRGITRYIHKLMLRHEHNVYQKLKGVDCIPECYGMVNNTYLVLEYISGQPIRQKRPEQAEFFFNKLLATIKQMHDSDVAHMDLKKKDNLLVTDDNQPCLIDFGAAVISKPGFHPFNSFHFSIGIRFDYNAWIKHKYHDNMQNISKDDARLYHRTFIENISSAIKSIYQNLKNRIHG